MVDKQAGLAVYIHWPYCTRICPYCDFNVYKARRDDDLVGAILQDLSHWRDWSGPRRVTSIHFGGGTPSLIPAQTLEAFITHIDDLWGLQPKTEIAIEANPNDYQETYWQDVRAAGINRLSLGIQSFHDPALSVLGRDHDAETAKTALSAARRIFPSCSADLIFGWAGQTLDMWHTDLNLALSYDVPHISTYQLTIEPGTAFARMEARGDFKGQPETPSSELYELSVQKLSETGYAHYEVSNFAKQGHRSQHNLAYWRGQDYVGVGPGAHGRLTRDDIRYATISSLRPETYTKQVETTGSGIDTRETLTPTERAEEYVLMGLRISEGICLKRYREFIGQDLNSDKLSEFIQDGYLMQTGERLLATAKGRLVLNHITEKLLV